MSSMLHVTPFELNVPKQPWDAIQKILNNWVDNIWGVGSSTHSRQILSPQLVQSW